VKNNIVDVLLYLVGRVTRPEHHSLILHRIPGNYMHYMLSETTNKFSQRFSSVVTAFSCLDVQKCAVNQKAV